MTRSVTPGVAADQVTTTLFRALAILRFVVMGWAIYKIADRMSEWARPGAAWTVLVVIVAWSVLMAWAYDAPRRRRWWLYGLDLALTVGLVLSSIWIQTGAQREHHVAHMPSFWVMAAVLAWTVGLGWWAGLAAALLVSAADVMVKGALTAQTTENIFLLVMGAALLGYTAQLLREAVATKAEADLAVAVAGERTRLARAVHDGTLQVLSLVQRRGLEAGGSFAELGRLAGEQEQALRSLIRQQDTVGASLPGESVDLGAALEQVVAGRSLQVTIATPGHPVPVPARVSAEVAAAVAACLDNVAAHVAPDAPAWVLLESLPGRVVVTVRDEGPGMSAHRVESAEAEGRLGVATSIRGRLADLGGTASLVTAPGQGVEWELSVPS